MSFTSSPHEANHQRHYLPAIEHARLEAALKGRPLPNVLPHSIEAGKDPYYIGNAYRRLQYNPWHLDTSERPYLDYIRKVMRGWPHLEYLADWMQITTSPPKWKHLPKTSRDMRAQKTCVAIIDFSVEANEKPKTTFIGTIGELRELFDDPQFSHAPDHPRLYIMEDLSRDMVEEFGSRYDVDPLLWRGHISDYMWYKTKDPWVELDELPHLVREKTFYNFRYIHPRYFEDKESHSRATIEAGKMNVLRSLDSDQYSERLPDSEERVFLCRSKASLWIQPRRNGKNNTFGILVVDPTFQEGYPLWSGYRNFEETPELQAINLTGPPRTSLFQDVVYWASKMGASDLDALAANPRNLALSILTIIASEWLTVLQYLRTRLTQLEWMLEIPDFRAPYRLDEVLGRLHPWHRYLPFYRRWVRDVLRSILHKDDLDMQSQHNQALFKLREDFLVIQEEFEIAQAQLDNMTNLVTAIISLEENKRMANQNSNVTRLTYLAVVFVPMSFVTGLFSMTTDVSALTQTFWIFFIVAIPLSFGALAAAQWIYLREWVKRQWRK